MPTTSVLLRTAESQGVLIFWTDAGYRFVKSGWSPSPDDWSKPFDCLEHCAHAAIAFADTQRALREVANV
jgi:hypothetical protein